MRIAKCLAFTLFLTTFGTVTTLGTGAARGEDLSWFAPAPTFPAGATSYSITLKGNVASDLNLTGTQTSSLLNPFQYVDQNIVGSGTTSVTAALNGSGNTVVTFTGSNPILPSYTFSYSNGNGMPHFGIDGSVGATIPGGGPALNIVSQSWTNGMSTTPVPSVSASIAGTPGPNAKYITFFADVVSNGATAGQWFEVPYTPGTSPKLTLTNYTGSNETLSNVGFMLSPTMIPLDNLNFGNEPPPGSPGSTFTPLPQYDGQNLPAGNGMGSPGGSLSETLPEPSSIVLLATGLLLPAGCFGRRRIAARASRTADRVA